MKVRTFALAALAALSLNAVAEENPWLVRLRATNLAWQNSWVGNTPSNQALNVNASNLTIPEVDVSYFFTKNIAAELVLTYPQTVNINTNATNLGSVQALPPSLLLQYHFTDLGNWKPYVGAGINYTIFTNNNVTSAISTQRTSYGLTGQVGVDYMINKNWGVNLDVKYIQMQTEVYSSGAKIGDLNLSPIATSIGLTYKF